MYVIDVILLGLNVFVVHALDAVPTICRYVSAHLCQLDNCSEPFLLTMVTSQTALNQPACTATDGTNCTYFNINQIIRIHLRFVSSPHPGLYPSTFSYVTCSAGCISRVFL